MDHVGLWQSVVLGIVEGLTEFLPISSTGHLIITGDLLNITGEKAKLFEVVIQLGAILAVVWAYKEKVVSLCGRMMRGDSQARRFGLSIMAAFMPAAVVGVLFHKAIKHYLFGPFTVACALVAGGIAILIIERMAHANRVTDMESTPVKTGWWVGVAQVFALFPGVSRSGATIMGGLLAGMTRVAATEFSFFLAIPTMFAATVFDLMGALKIMSSSDLVSLSVGFITAFISALWVVRWLIRFVSTNSFRVFAWYRIVFGGILLAYYLSK